MGVSAHRTSPAQTARLVGLIPALWAWLLAQAGADVDAFDVWPGAGERNHWTEDVQWAEVRRGGSPILEHHPARTLLLCWPPYSDPMALACLRTFRGDHLVYIGEGEGGCTASDEFFAELERAWEGVREIAIPQWPGLRDYVSIWRRR